MRKYARCIFGAVLFVLLFIFLSLYCSYTYSFQEEYLLFLCDWAFVAERLSIPGGACLFIGQFLTQCYAYPIVGAAINGLLLSLIALFVCNILHCFHKHLIINDLMALMPLPFLLKANMNMQFVSYGTVGILLLLACLQIFIRLSSNRTRLIYGILSTLLLYYLVGQIVLIYAIILIPICLLNTDAKWYSFVPALCIGSFLTYMDIRMSLHIPLGDGIYSERYQEAQLHPDSYIYYVWIRFFLLLFALFLLSGAIRMILKKSKTQTVVVGVLFLGLLFAGCFNRPAPSNVHDQKIRRLSYLSRHQDWDGILASFKNKKITDYLELNMLNMALANRGELGDRLFEYEQKGPLGLIATWDGSPFTSALLSDIHYLIGDISLSEGYAMDGLRDGSPRMLKRLVEISLIRQDWKLAEKYLNILSRRPLERKWVKAHEKYLGQADGFQVHVRKPLPSIDDNLLCMIDLDELWKNHLTEPGSNRTAWEYLGSSYLLANEMERFKELILLTCEDVRWQPLPKHFQEAVLALALEDPSLLSKVDVANEQVERFKKFQMDVSNAINDPEKEELLHHQYKDTFWMYILKNTKQ